MNKFYRFISRYREIIMAVIDTVIVIFSYWLAYFVRTDFGRLSFFMGEQSLWVNMIWVVLINLITVLAFGLNRSLWMFVSVDEALRVSAAVFTGNLIWWSVVMIFKIPEYTRSIPVIAAMIQLIMMLGIRLVYRVVRRDGNQKKRQHRALILGAGSAGVNALREITYSDRYDTRIIGFLDKNPKKVKKRLNGIVVLGTDDQMAEIVQQYDIDTAYIAIKNISKNDLKDLIEKCRELNLRTRIVSFELHANAEGSTTSVRNVSINDLLGRGELNLNNAEIGAYLAGKTVMVTGAGGSIGSELVRQIMQFKPKRFVLDDIYENNMYELQQEINIARRAGTMQTETEVICLLGSVRDKKRINQIMQKYQPDVVFHAAAHKHVPLVEDSPLEAIKNNVIGTRNVIECCIMNNVDKFVMISTDKAVRSTNVMGATKRMCELLVEGYKNNGITKLCAVRFGNVLGSSGSVIPLFEKQIEQGGPVTVTDPNIIRYFMTIPEAAQLVLQAGAYAHTGEIFILDMGKPVKIVDLAKNLIQLSGLVPDEDIEIKFTGLRPGEKLYEELLVDPKNSKKTENDLIYIAEPETITMDAVNQKVDMLKELVEENDSDNQKIIQIITSSDHKENA
jgi:Predicted nucleoside-diphosphate sugar epimerases